MCVHEFERWGVCVCACIQEREGEHARACETETQRQRKERYVCESKYALIGYSTPIWCVF